MKTSTYFRHAATRRVFCFTGHQNSGFTLAAYSAAKAHFGDGNFMAFLTTATP